MPEYEAISYRMSVSDGCDTVHVEKDIGSAWCKLRMVTNCAENGDITIRSKDMAMQLHFMLGQMLGE